MGQFIIPDLISMQSSKQLLEGTDIKLGAPDCFWEDAGAFTGEVSPMNLKELGVGIVELGHAERRRLFGETDETVALKARAVLRNSMIPLICIGERTQSSIQDALSEVQPQVEQRFCRFQAHKPAADHRTFCCFPRILLHGFQVFNGAVDKHALFFHAR